MNNKDVTVGDYWLETENEIYYPHHPCRWVDGGVFESLTDEQGWSEAVNEHNWICGYIRDKGGYVWPEEDGFVFLAGTTSCYDHGDVIFHAAEASAILFANNDPLPVEPLPPRPGEPSATVATCAIGGGGCFVSVASG